MMAQQIVYDLCPCKSTITSPLTVIILHEVIILKKSFLTFSTFSNPIIHLVYPPPPPKQKRFAQALFLKSFMSQEKLQTIILRGKGDVLSWDLRKWLREPAHF